jgi:hypothetical protein
MSKQEEEKGLFDNVELNSPDAVDESFFMQDPTTRNETEPPATPTGDAGDNTNPEGDNPEGDKGGDPNEVDSKFFEDNVDNTDDNTSSNDGPSANNNSSSPLQLVTKALQAEGLITLDEEELEKIDSVKDLLPAWRKKMVDEEFSDLNDNQKAYVKALRNGIPEEAVKQNFKNLEALNSLTPEIIQDENNVELRKNLIAEKYKAKGMSDAEAIKLATRSIEVGEDAADALVAFTDLKTIEGERITKATEEAETLKKQEAEARQKQLSELKDKVLNTEEFMPGHKPNSTTKEKIFSNMSNVVDYDEQGNGLNAIMAAKRKDPDKFAMMESYFYTITKGYTDFSTFKNTAKTSAIDEIDKQLAQSNTGGGTPKGIPSSTGAGLADAIKNLKI